MLRGVDASARFLITWKGESDPEIKGKSHR